MHRSNSRDAYEAKMAFNPDQKAELLSKSQHRRHKLMVQGMLEKVQKAQQAVEKAQEGEGNVPLPGSE